MDTKTELLKKVRQENGKNIDIYAPSDDIKEIYVDGAEIILGMPISKLQFHSTEGIEKQDDMLVEKREVKARIVIPTNVLLELTLNILIGMKENQQHLSDNIEAYKEQLIKNISKINFFQKEKENT